MYIVCILSLSYINGFIIHDKSISAAAFTTTVHHLHRRQYHKHIKLHQTFDVATRQRHRRPLLFMSSSSNDEGGNNKSELSSNDNEELSMAIAKVRLEQSVKPA